MFDQVRGYLDKNPGKPFNVLCKELKVSKVLKPYFQRYLTRIGYDGTRPFTKNTNTAPASEMTSNRDSYSRKIRHKNNNTLTVEDLTTAIKNSIDKSGMETRAAKAMAMHVLNFFGYDDRIIDNVLEPEDRDAFYMLEDSGILTTEREETTLFDGREWRIHYWLFRKDKIRELVEAQKEKERIEAEEDQYLIYGDIPDDIWNRTSEDEEEEATA